MIPDRTPDRVVSRPLPMASATSPCPDCGKSCSTHLTLLDAVELHGYGTASCLNCRLTNIPRAVPLG